jgi:hypothetical protein
MVDSAFLYVLAIAALGAATLWSAVPVGIALGLDPWTVCVAAAAGAGLGTALVLALSDRVGRAPPATLATFVARRHGLLYRAWTRYGVPGFGLLAPLLIGAPLGAAAGILMRVPAGRLAFWLMAGIVLWSAILTYTAALGLAPLLSCAETGERAACAIGIRIARSP